MTSAFGAFWRRYFSEHVSNAFAWLPALVFIGAAFTIAGIGWQVGASLSVGKDSLRTARPLFGNAGKAIGADATQNIQEAVERAAQALSDARIRHIDIKITYAGDEKQ